MPSRAHEDAIVIIREYMNAEFNKITFIDSPRVGTLRPDLMARVGEGYIVVEVGSTTADKIKRYLANKSIYEIRWYTKKTPAGVNLVGQWRRGEQSRVRLRTKAHSAASYQRNLDGLVKNLKDELRNRGIHYNDCYVCCTGCGVPLKMEQMMVINHYGRQYVVCSDCHHKGNLHIIRDFVFNNVGWLNERGQSANA